MKVSISLMLLFQIVLGDIGLSYAQLQRKPTLGMLDLKGVGIPENEAIVISERLVECLLQLGDYVVVERSQMKTILKEQGFQLTGACDTKECAVEVGQLIGAERMVGGSVGKVGNVYTLSVRMFEVETGRIMAAASGDYKGSVDVLLTRGACETASKLSLEPKKKSRKWLWIGLVTVAALGGGALAILQGDKEGKDTIPMPPSHP